MAEDDKDNENIWTVYIHRNKINNKCYIGITSNKPEYRWNHGRGYLVKINDKYSQPKFAHAINKYGWDNFEHIIFAEKLSYEKACDMERLLIALWDTIDNGYNDSLGGEAIFLGRHHTEESKRKIGEAQKGENNCNYGKPMPEDRKIKMKKTLSEKFSGENNPFYGKKHSDQTKEKMRNNHVDCSGSNNSRAKRVNQYTIDGDFIKTWDFIKQAADELGISKSPISGCCKHKYGFKTAGGFIWRYADEDESIGDVDGQRI